MRGNVDLFAQFDVKKITLLLLIFFSFFCTYPSSSEAGEVSALAPRSFYIGNEKFEIPEEYFYMTYPKSKTEMLEFTIKVDYPKLRPFKSNAQVNRKSGLDNTLLISVSQQKNNPLFPFEDEIKFEEAHGKRIELKSTFYGLYEVYDGYFPNARDGDKKYVGSIGNFNVEILSQYIKENGKDVPYFCYFDYPYRDLRVHLQFGQSNLSKWKDVYAKSLQILNHFIKD